MRGGCAHAFEGPIPGEMRRFAAWPAPCSGAGTMHARPTPAPVAPSQLLAERFGAHAVTHGGTLASWFDARGVHRGARVHVRLEMANTRREGMKPFTTVEVEEDLDVYVEQGSAHVVSSNVPFLPFAQPALAGRALYGAPASLLARMTNGASADRLAALQASGRYVSEVGVGSAAKRVGCASRGVHLVVGGWPEDGAALAFLLDTVVGIAEDARCELAPALLGRVPGARHPEMLALDAARAEARRIAKLVGLVTAAVLAAASATALVLALALARG